MIYCAELAGASFEVTFESVILFLLKGRAEKAFNDVYWISIRTM